jgi:FtsZ-binding cell division protein ZapB
MSEVTEKCAELLLFIQKTEEEVDVLRKNNASLKQRVAELRIELDKLQREAEDSK